MSSMAMEDSEHAVKMSKIEQNVELCCMLYKLEDYNAQISINQKDNVDVLPTGLKKIILQNVFRSTKEKPIYSDGPSGLGYLRMTLNIKNISCLKLFIYKRMNGMYYQ